MKKTLAIVLALVLVLCATVALAAEGTLKNGNYVAVDGHHHYWFSDAKALAAAATIASGTNLPCEWVANAADTQPKPVTTYEKLDELSHQKVVSTTLYGHCKFCVAPMDPQTDVVTSIEAHTLVRGAYMGRNYDIVSYAHSDSAHLIAYDQYVSVCSVCKESVIENVPVYEAHTFRTAKPIGYYADGSEKYGKGSTCAVCGYARAYKMLTTAAGKKVDEIIAAYEAAGLTVEFDANQMIAVGIEEGEAVEVEEGICGVNTIMFTNFSPIKKGNTNKAKTDLDITYEGILFFELDEEESCNEKADLFDADSSKKTQDEHSHVNVADKTAETDTYEKYDVTGFASYDNVIVDEYGEVEGQWYSKKNLVQDTKSYSAAFVTMYVEGIAHRVYFYERHDGNGWVYAFEADMYADVKEVVLPEYEVDDRGFKYKAYEAFVTRTGAGQEYATNGVIAAGKTIKSIGLAYEGSDKNQYGKEVGSETLYKGKTWGWDMIDDWTFVATSRIAAK